MNRLQNSNYLLLFTEFLTINIIMIIVTGISSLLNVSNLCNRLNNDIDAYL